MFGRLIRIRKRNACCDRPRAALGLLALLFCLAIFVPSIHAEPINTVPPDDQPLSIPFDSNDWPVGDVESLEEVIISDECSSCPVSAGQLLVFSELLVFSVTEGGADNWAQEITPRGPAPSFGTANVVDAPFDWKAGFRLGIAKRLDDQFDLTFYYTNFNTTATNQAAGEVTSAFLGNFYAGNTDGTGFGPSYRRADIDWDFSFQTFDFEIGRTSWVGPAMLRPYVGLKAAIIDQTAVSHWFDPIDTMTDTYLFTSAVETLTQEFWGIGPSFGVAATVPLSAGPDYSLQVFASPSAALMYGHWQFRDHYQNDGPTSISSPVPASIDINMSPIDGLSTTLRGMFGIQWLRQCARLTTSVRLTYESQIWLNQMQFYSFNMGRLNNLMALHGGALEIGILF